MTLLKGVEHLTPIRGVPAGHNWLTPQIGVVLTPLFLQCDIGQSSTSQAVAAIACINYGTILYYIFLVIVSRFHSPEAFSQL